MKMQHELKVYQRIGRYDFTESEIDQFKTAIPPREIQAKAEQAKIDDLKSQIKTIQAKIETLREENYQDSKRVENGWENQSQSCYRLKDWDNRRFVFFSISTQKFVYEQEFSIEDSQMSMDSFMDMQEINFENREKYEASISFEGKWYSFGPKKQEENEEE